MYLLTIVFFLFQLLACYSAKNDLHPKTGSVDTSGISITTEDSLPGKDLKHEKFDVDYIMGHFDPATHPDFVEVEIKYSDREGRYLRKDTYEAFKKMYEEALKVGIQLRIISATRNFNRQKELWEGKWTGEHLIEGGENLAKSTPDPKMRALKILHYSAMPGTSRHHWGTDIDLDSLENNFFENGEGLRIYNWLVSNGPRFGFCQPYSAGRPYGYLEEKWHWSYMPVSVLLTGIAKRDLKNEMITGFLGSESAVLIDVVDHYVLGINKDCTR